VSGGELVGTAGLLRVDLSLSGEVGLDRTLTPDDVAATGRLQLAAEDFALPDLAEDIDGSGEITLALADGRLDAEIASGELRIAALAAALARLHEPLPPPWDLELADGARPLRASGELADDGVGLELDGALRLTAGPATVALDLTANMAGDGSGRLTTAGGRARVGLQALRWPAATLEQGTLELTGEGSPESWRGTLDLALSGSGQPTPALGLAGATLRHRLALSFADRQLTVRAREAGELAIARLAWQAAGEAGPLALVLPPQEAPLLSATLPAAGGLTWNHQLQAAGQGFPFALAPLAGRAEVGALTLALAGDQDGLSSGRIALADGRLRLPAWQLTVAGIAGEVALADGGLAPEQAIPLGAASISHGGTPAWFAPLALRATLRPRPEALAFQARLGGPDRAFALALDGRHVLASGRGRATVDLAPLTFAPGQLQPNRLAPVLGDLLDGVSGTVALEGTLGWGAGDGIAADLQLLLEELAFATGPARFSRVNGVVEIDQLSPLTTPPGQQLAIGLLDLGLPLTRGLVVFELQPGPALAVERLRWDFAGGTIRAAPFRVGSAVSDIILTLEAERLDLAQLFALTRLDGLSGEGTISGTLPIRISGAEAVIEGGELRALGPGWLRYRSAGVPAALQQGGENVSLLLQALENFRYEALRITLDGRTDAEMDIGLHVEGANPDLYDGYPIEFNLDLEGELANILRSGLASYQIPERIRERMQGFRR
jgi:Dicarboxylate transport